MSYNAAQYINAINIADAAGTLAPFPTGWTPPSVAKSPQFDTPDENGAVAFTNLDATSGGIGKRFIINELVLQSPVGSRARLFGVPNLNRERALELILDMNMIECLDIVVGTDGFGNASASLDKHKPIHGTYALDPTTCGTVSEAFAMLNAWNQAAPVDGAGGKFVPDQP